MEEEKQGGSWKGKKKTKKIGNEKGLFPSVVC